MGRHKRSADQLRQRFELKADAAPGVCLVQGCKKPLARRKGKPFGDMCQTHRHAMWRHLNPATACYNNIRCKAKQRRVPFLLTRQEWDGFCEQTQFVEQRRAAPDYRTSPSIDRKDAKGPYALWNIQVLTVGENSRKGITIDRPLYIGGRRMARAEYKPEPREDF